MTEVFRTYDPATDGEATNRLWDRVFPNPKGGQDIDWLFRRGPAGISQRTVAEVNNDIVAHAGAVPVRFRVNGVEHFGGYSVAAMTDESMRGRGLYVQLSRHLYEQMKQSGFSFVAGFANRNSHRIMVQQLERVAIQPFPWCVRMLRPLSLLLSLSSKAERAIPPISFAEASEQGVSITPCDCFDVRFDEIWQRAKESVSVGAIRDAEFIRWRFGSHANSE